MELIEIARKIPPNMRNDVAEKIVDLILTSKRAENMPSSLAKTILFYWQRDQLSTDTGMGTLLEAGILVEPEATVTLLNEFGLDDVARLVKEMLPTTSK